MTNPEDQLSPARRLLRRALWVGGELLGIPLLVIASLIAVVVASLVYTIGVWVLAAVVIGLPAFYVTFGILSLLNWLTARRSRGPLMRSEIVENVAAIVGGSTAIVTLAIIVVRRLAS